MKLEPLNISRSPAVVKISSREPVVACEWCSCDGKRYVRHTRGGDRSEDLLDLCDECATDLKHAITRRLNHFNP